MKKFLVFIAVLLSNCSASVACGYDPYGEDIRYSLFLPSYFDYQDYNAFNYNTQAFGFEYTYQSSYEANVFDWYNYTNKTVAIEAIEDCLNNLTLTDIQPGSNNAFVQYLYKNKLNSVILYLITAKKCEDFNNNDLNDPWEENPSKEKNSKAFLNQLERLLKNEKDLYLKRKYAFITIRTAYYANDFKRLHNLFNKHFATGLKDYLYYWALYFNAFDNKNASIDIANIMAYSPEKRYASYYYFHEQFNLEKALSIAKSNSDIANLYAYASVQRLQPNLDYLEKIYQNSNKSRILDFLLLREINKIEDWIYTPYYTNYLPSVDYVNDWLNEQSTETLRARSEKDRLYAGQVLAFVKSIDYTKIADVALWKAAEIQLLFMTRDYETCLTKISAFETQYDNEKVLIQIEKIKALCYISNQANGKAIIKAEAKPIILRYLNDAHFIFSIGRELEFRGNLPDGLALIAYANQKITDRYNTAYTNMVNWQDNRLKNVGNLVYFYDYFAYTDFVYSASELQTVINHLDEKNEDSFYQTIYSQLLEDKQYLKDLLGTKYIRENNLTVAEKTFASIGNTYWEENYNGWERDRYEDYYTFDKNPFYDFNYTPAFIPHDEQYIVTKLSVTQHLIQYIALANNPATKDRDYYYFIVGNCYLNMTQYGHSWMMRRYTSTSYIEEGSNESYSDEMEYRNGELAQQYYHLAYEHAQTDQFKALCLRMEEYAKYNIGSEYETLQTLYPNYYEDLSNCDNLETFFKARRQEN